MLLDFIKKNKKTTTQFVCSASCRCAALLTLCVIPPAEAIFVPDLPQENKTCFTRHWLCSRHCSTHRFIWATGERRPLFPGNPPRAATCRGNATATTAAGCEARQRRVALARDLHTARMILGGEQHLQERGVPAPTSTSQTACQIKRTGV